MLPSATYFDHLVSNEIAKTCKSKIRNRRNHNEPYTIEEEKKI